MKKIALLFLFAAPAFSSTLCPQAKITRITIEGTKIMYVQEGSNYRTLGLAGEPGVDAKLSLMLAAQFAEKEITVSYEPDNFDCGAPNYSTFAKAVTVINE